MLAGGIGFYIHGIRAEQSKTEAALVEVQKQKDEADHQREHARRQEAQAKEQAAIAESGSQFLTDMLASADPSRQLGDKVTVAVAVGLVQVATGAVLGKCGPKRGRHEEHEPREPSGDRFH